MRLSAPYALQKLRRKFLLIRLLEVLCWSLAIATIGFGMLNLANLDKVTLGIVTSLMLFIVAGVASFILKIYEINVESVVQYLNKRYEVLEYSSDLLLRDKNELTLLQQLQQQKTSDHLNSLYSSIRIPHRLKLGAGMLIVSVLIAVALTGSDRNSQAKYKHQTEDQVAQDENKLTLPASIKQVKISIKPPAYTGLKLRSVTYPQIQIEEGSNVHWDITFNNPVDNVQITFSKGDSVQLKNKDLTFYLDRTFNKSDFYQITWRDQDKKVSSSDYYKIEVTPDRAPGINMHDLPQFTAIALDEQKMITIKSDLADDYGIKDAYIIATVSKGSGESVKFREEKLKFSSPANFNGKTITAARTIDLIKLGLEPGDELYFYAEAIDNKTPTPNRTRTETYFVALQDTSSQSMSFEGGLGVDIMPEYFRSQRQIIIDSEKLLSDKKNITRQEFNSRSNELGFDQKILRLKYGEFLGEEFESGIGDQSFELEDSDGHQHHDDEENLVKQFGHAHDSDNEHHHVEEHKPVQQHSHQHANKDDEKENPLEAFIHSHDNEEEATFFITSIKTKLKAALTIMWDAELNLRLYDPKKSLPHQYKALKLLKEISNQSRIYVHKTGFDPPPLKEDKRLTGDLDEIKRNTRQQTNLKKETLFPDIRNGLTVTEYQLQQQKITLTNLDKNILAKAGNELAVLALESPAYLESLSLIKKLNEDQIDATQMSQALKVIRKAFYKALPDQIPVPSRINSPSHTLDRAFIKNMNSFRND